TYLQNLAAWVHRYYWGLRSYMAAGIAAFEITWWGSVDFISKSPYYSLSNAALHPMPKVANLVSVWRYSILPSLYTLYRKFNRPVLFGEIGYCSIQGATSSPWEHRTNTLPASQLAQADAYDALLQATSGV